MGKSIEVPFLLTVCVVVNDLYQSTEPTLFSRLVQVINNNTAHLQILLLFTREITEANLNLPEKWPSEND
jgi:hypothetical protein